MSSLRAPATFPISTGRRSLLTRCGSFWRREGLLGAVASDGWVERMEIRQKPSSGEPMVGSLRSTRIPRFPSMQRYLLDSQIGNLADVEVVLAAAVDGVDEVELLRGPPRPAKLADHGAVQLQLVDLAGDIDVVRRI